MSSLALITIVILLLGLSGFWWLLFRNRAASTQEVFPESWRTYLQDHVRFYQQLIENEKSQFEDRILQFLGRVKITGIGIDLSVQDRLLVASSGVIPVFHFPHWQRYPNLDEVLVYPNSFREEDYATEGDDRSVLGMVGWGPMNRKMILSLPSLRQGFSQEGRTNTGIHEFIHLIDKADGATDGIPEYFLQKQYVLPWMKLIYREMAAIRDGHSDIPPYGATNETEFFAVAATYFFQQPKQFKDAHPELYELMELIFLPNTPTR
ncbi:MAG: zinc-dependent peptidase [Saprospiraceae bacterium]|nr:zinc-dependent peptidase [Saprospiraceae bacterium]